VYQPFQGAGHGDEAKLNDLMLKFQEALYGQMRLAGIKSIRNLCQKAVKTGKVGPETILELFTVMISIVAIAAPIEHSEEGFAAVQEMGKLFELMAKTQSPDSPLFGGPMTPLHPDIEQILRDLDKRDK
jgi:hypothetical protein